MGTTITLDGEEISIELAEFSSVRPPYDSQTEEILYKRELDDIIDRNDLAEGDGWLVFEDLALRAVVSSREVDSNTRKFDSPRREEKTQDGPKKYFRVQPDGVEDLEFRNVSGIGGGTFKDGVFVEAKYYNPKGIYLDTPRSTRSPEAPGSWQITGHLDALRRTEAGEKATNANVPALFLATPAGVKISTDLIKQASDDGVAVYHSVLTTPLGNDNGVEFRMSESAILNPGLYRRKGLTPLDYGPGNYKELRSETEIKEARA